MRTMAAQSDDHCLTNYVYKFSPDVLKDQVAFITGGGSGIGMRIAEILMRLQLTIPPNDKMYTLVQAWL